MRVEGGHGKVPSTYPWSRLLRMREATSALQNRWLAGDNFMVMKCSKFTGPEDWTPAEVGDAIGGKAKPRAREESPAEEAAAEAAEDMT